MRDNLFMTVRLGLGLLGALWLLSGLYCIVVTSADHAWGPMRLAGLTALVGFLLAYAAFIEMPWECHARRRNRAT